MNKKKIPNLINFLKINDKRGKFCKIYNQNIKNKYNLKIKEVNFSFNKKKGTLRGMHYQDFPKNEEKLVCCIKGSVFDALIDLRKSSKNFLKHKIFILDDKVNKMLYIPKGFAHGFQTLTDNTTLIYMHSEKFFKRLDRGINPLDENLNINWPIRKKIMSPKDKKLQKIYNFKGL